MSDNDRNINSGGNRDNQWRRWEWGLVLRGVGLVFVLVIIMLFVCKLYVYPPEYIKTGEWAIALIAWKDFLLGAVVVAFIWFVRSLWE